MSVIAFFILLVLALALQAMLAAYATLSTSHLRHWAKQKDPAAKKLYPLKARGSAAWLMLELLYAMTFSAAFVLLAAHMALGLAWFITVLLVFIALTVLVQLYLKPYGMQLLVWFSAPLLSLTHALKIVTLPLGRVMDNFLDAEPVTLTRADLSKTLKAVEPEDTDLSVDELKMLSSMLTFSEHTVHEAMTPKRRVVSVKLQESLSPVVLDELHKSGQDYFPVMHEDGKTVVGMLAMQDLRDIAHHTDVAEAMHDKVQVIDETEPLPRLINLFYTSKQPAFVAVNSSGAMTGLITMEAVIEELFGKPEAVVVPADDPPEVQEPERIAEQSPAVVE